MWGENFTILSSWRVVTVGWYDAAYMSSRLKYLPELRALPAEERRAYVRELRQSLDEDEEADPDEVAESWLVEIRRRIREDDEHGYDPEEDCAERFFAEMRELTS